MINLFCICYQIIIDAHYTGERISTYSIPNDELLPYYIQTNAAVQYHLSLLEHKLSIILHINNLLDRQFESINGFPEPGRNFRIGIKYFLSKI